MSRLGVPRILRQLVPRHIARKRCDELRGRLDIIAVALRLQNAGERDSASARQLLSEPALLRADVVAIQREPPLSNKRSRSCMHKRCLRGLCIQQPGTCGLYRCDAGEREELATRYACAIHTL